MSDEAKGWFGAAVGCGFLLLWYGGMLVVAVAVLKWAIGYLFG
jgi:hypothetical protein